MRTAMHCPCVAAGAPPEAPRETGRRLLGRSRLADILALAAGPAVRLHRYRNVRSEMLADALEAYRDREEP